MAAAAFSSNVLVTGGAGYVGSHCCKALARAGVVPVVFDNLSTGHRDFARWGPLVEGDVRDFIALVAAIERFRPSAVIHCAALGDVGESMAHPGRYSDVNVGGTLALLDAMQYRAVDKLVFSSTCAIYGEPAVAAVAENVPQLPVNPYGLSMLEAERIMDHYDAVYGVRSVRLRCFSIAGADPEGEIGEDHETETHLIPAIMDAALGRRRAVTMLGGNYATEDGTAVRDYVHVADVASAHLKALAYLATDGSTVAVNIGVGVGTSVAQVVRAAEGVVGHEIKITYRSGSDGGASRMIADPRKAKQVLGWKPQYPGLEEILAHAWSWHRRRFAGDRRSRLAIAASDSSGPVVRVD